ncbi:MAG: hypothetical protein ACM34A_17620, partial [Bacillota bacterium]
MSLHWHKRPDFVIEVQSIHYHSALFNAGKQEMRTRTLSAARALSAGVLAAIACGNALAEPL